MAGSAFPRVAGFSGGLICAAAIVAYAGVGLSLGRPENQALAGLPAASRLQASELYSSIRWAPWNSSDYVRLGMFFLANGRPGPAIEWLRRATVWDSGSWHAWYYLGLAERAAHHSAPAESAFTKVLALNSDYVAAKAQLAGVLLDQGQFDGAATAYSALIGTGADQGRALRGLGTALLGMRSYPDAERAFSEAVARFPTYGEAHAGLATVLQAQGEELRAAREARLARNWRDMVPLRTDDPLTEQMEQDFPTALSLVQTAVRNRDPQMGLETMEKALALDPAMVLGWEDAIAMYGQAHRPKDAQRAWERLAKLDPNNIRGRFDLALVFTQAGDRVRAMALLNEVISIDPSYADAHRIRGLVAELDGNRDEAMREIRTALEKDPSLAEAHVDLGLLFVRWGQAREGQTELLKALLPPCEQPARTLVRELSGLKDPIAEQAFEQAVRVQAEAYKQPGLITILNNRKKPRTGPPVGNGVPLSAAPPPL